MTNRYLSAVLAQHSSRAALTAVKPTRKRNSAIMPEQDCHCIFETRIRHACKRSFYARQSMNIDNSRSCGISIVRSLLRKRSVFRPATPGSGYRRYSDDDVARLDYPRAQALGFRYRNQLLYLPQFAGDMSGVTGVRLHRNHYKKLAELSDPQRPRSLDRYMPGTSEIHCPIGCALQGIMK